MAETESKLAEVSDRLTELKTKHQVDNLGWNHRVDPQGNVQINITLIINGVEERLSMAIARQEVSMMVWTVMEKVTARLPRKIITKPSSAFSRHSNK